MAAFPELRDHALTLAWAAVALGRQASQLLQLARAGELLLVAGPWAMREVDSPGYFVPAWQLRPDGTGPYPDLPVLLAAAADAGWTSLELNRFMITPIDVDGTTPAALLRAGDGGRVTALVRGESLAPRVLQPTKRRRRARRRPGAAYAATVGGRR